jgi:hypothetical protein
MRALTYIAARWYEVRAARALRSYLALTRKAEKFFRRLDGGRG